MTDNTNAVSETKVVKAAKKVAKKVPAKAVAKASANGKSLWREKKVKVFKAIKSFANGATEAKIAEKSGVENAGHYIYHGVRDDGIYEEVVHDEAGKNVRYFVLTAKGKKVDLAKVAAPAK